MKDLVDHLKWRYATKKMDASKKVAEKDIDYVKDVIQLTATSYGLQPFKVLDIRDENVRERLKPAAWNQTQITDASHLFLFVNQLETTEENVDNYIEKKAELSNIEVSQLSGYGDFIKIKMKEKSAVEMVHWTAKQAYLALSSALMACAELKIDATPMEGFDPAEVNKILDLESKGLTAATFLAIGYRHEEDVQQDAVKVRKSKDDLFQII